MADGPAGALLRHIQNLAEMHIGQGLTDGELLQRFAVHRDDGAFAALLRRHGRLVWSVCRHILRHEHDAEDAFQATFLVLSQRAGSIRKAESVGSWLHAIAYRIALRAKKMARKRQEPVRLAAASGRSRPSSDLAWQELQAIVDQELARLPEKYRTPFICCCLEGRSRKEAAVELGWKEGTVSSRIAHARRVLQERLARRGVVLSAALTAAVLWGRQASAAMPPSLMRATIQAAARLSAGQAAGGVVSAKVIALVDGATRAVLGTKLAVVTALLLAAGLAVGSASLVARQPPPAQAAATSETARAESTGPAGAPNAQEAKRPSNKPVQHRVIVQPPDSVPGPDQEPDCVFMPSPPKVVDAMLKLADVQRGEILFDLGSGDGRICIAAAKGYQARAFGYEIQADLVKTSLENVKKNKLEHLVTIERRDIFKLDLSGADAITLWLLPSLNVKLIPQLEKLKPGSRIVSFDFAMGDIVKPDKVVEVEVPEIELAPWHWPQRKGVIYLWKTPLKKDEKLFRKWSERQASRRRP